MQNVFESLKDWLMYIVLYKNVFLKWIHQEEVSKMFTINCVLEHSHMFLATSFLSRQLSNLVVWSEKLLMLFQWKQCCCEEEKSEAIRGRTENPGG